MCLTIGAVGLELWRERESRRRGLKRDGEGREGVVREVFEKLGDCGKQDLGPGVVRMGDA